MISRRILRGKKLESECKRARTAAHQYGKNDDRVFCYGLIDCMNDEFLAECVTCGAFVDNAEPPQDAAIGKEMK